MSECDLDEQSVALWCKLVSNPLRQIPPPFKRMAQFDGLRHSPFPNRMLECRFDDNGNLVGQELINGFKEKVGYDPIGFRRKLVMLYANSIDVTFLYFVAADRKLPFATTSFTFLSFAKLICEVLKLTPKTRKIRWGVMSIFSNRLILLVLSIETHI